MEGDLLDVRDIKSLPSLDYNGFTYILIRKSNTQWEVKKIADDYPIAVYILNLIRNKWTCDCPAGQRDRNCKHRLWVDVLERAGVR